MITAEVHSTAFDTYVGLMSPSNETSENDDHNGSKDHSQVIVTATESGEWNLVVTSYAAGETGAFRATVSLASPEGASEPVASTASPSTGGSGGAIDTDGTLDKGDDRLNGGEYYDVYSFQASAGDELTAVVTSTAFDTYVVLKSPSGEAWGNDDHDNSKDRSELTVTADAAGEWALVVTSYEGGETGAYHTSLSQVAAGTAAGSGGEDRHTGSLGPGDSTLDSGEYVDGFELKGRAGEHVVIDLRSDDFDTYLALGSPSGEMWQNDDHESSSHRSQLSMELPETGTYTVAITSYKPAETGDWQVTITRSNAEAATESGPIQEAGQLGQGDIQLESGEYVDMYSFEGLPGQHARIDLSSSVFDTYLVLVSPEGETEENDDSPEQLGHSLIDTRLTEAGTYRVGVTSYKPAETGAYELTIALDDGHESGDVAQRDVSRLQVGGSVQGSLEAGDSTLESGEFNDIYTFDGRAGQSISVSLTATDFDPYVGIQLTSGEIIENDDWENKRDQSRIDLQLPETGRYKVIATSYSPGATGSYSLALSELSGGDAPAPSRPTNDAAGGDIYGIFVGISDYPGTNNDLSYTADDARVLHQAFVQSVGMKPSNAVVLTDTEATVGNVRAAFERFGGQMGADDRFVFFYSGHGVRVPRKGEFQSADPDGQDETLALYDEMLTDDDFAVWLDGIPGTSLVVLDACFSGGFAKDIITRPGRMGLFSSHEDVTSAVAVKFRAGGFLARFMAEAIGDKLADEDGDGQLTALELSQYLYDRYRADVKAMHAGPEPTVQAPSDGDKAAPQMDYVLTSRNLGYQQLIVDRGGVNPYQVLFAW